MEREIVLIFHATHCFIMLFGATPFSYTGEENEPTFLDQEDLGFLLEV